jgi:Arc/MetJ-type ribon-helix-helix transcriptional regulator
MNDLIHIRIDKATKQLIEQKARLHHFSSTSEFVKDAVRKQLESYEKLEALSRLAQLKESVKAPRLTKKQRSQLVEKGLSSARDILKEYELE